MSIWSNPIWLTVNVPVTGLRWDVIIEWDFGGLLDEGIFSFDSSATGVINS